MNASEYKKEIAKLFERWESKPAKGKINHSDRFIKDGVICPEKWFSQKIRPLFFFKEAYTQTGENSMKDLVEGHLKIDKPIDKMWQRVSTWTRSLMEMAETGEIPPFKKPDRITRYGNPYLNQIAVMNIKKSSGEKTSNEENLNLYAEYDAEEIYNQLVLCDPNIIICGYTGRFVIELLDKKCQYKETVTPFDSDHFLYKYEFNSHKLAVICYWHPANHYPDFLNYYGLMHILHHIIAEDTLEDAPM